MCLIIAKPAGKDIPTRWVESAANQNKDSLGIAYYDDKGRQRIHKWVTPNAERVKAAIKLLDSLTDRAVLVHFRYTTHGKTNEANCHPFPITKDAVIAHNGVIPGYVCPEGECSDTVLFIRKNILPFVQEYGYKAILPHLNGLYKEDLGSSKLCALTKDGEFFYANEKLGTWREGMWLSNTYSVYSYTPSYSSDESFQEWQKRMGFDRPNRFPTGDRQDREWDTSFECWIRKDGTAWWDEKEGEWVLMEDIPDEDEATHVELVEVNGVTMVYDPYTDTDYEKGVLVPENTPALPPRSVSSALYTSPPMSDGVAKVGRVLPAQHTYRVHNGTMTYNRLTGQYDFDPDPTAPSALNSRIAGMRGAKAPTVYEQAIAWQICPECGRLLSSDNYCLECRHTVHSRGVIAGPPMPLDRQMMLELNGRLREAEMTDPVHLG